MKDLTTLQEGQGARVEALTAQGGMRRRLMDLGFTRGAPVFCLFSAPGNGMRAYRIRSAVVALRGRDAQTVRLEEETHA